jgi:hypothetical protein
MLHHSKLYAVNLMAFQITRHQAPDRRQLSPDATLTYPIYDRLFYPPDRLSPYADRPLFHLERLLHHLDRPLSCLDRLTYHADRSLFYLKSPFTNGDSSLFQPDRPVPHWNALYLISIASVLYSAVSQLTMIALFSIALLSRSAYPSSHHNHGLRWCDRSSFLASIPPS